jgi:protein-S-isoprenylcysteine O-methyltransferase Ste14
VLGYFLFEPTLANLASALCIFLYLPLGIYLEEKKLIQQYGDRYIQYKKEVPAILPKI